MKAVCFVKRLQWDFSGTLLRQGLTIGDVDNDGDNELIAGTAEGDLYIFKGPELWQKITGLGMITSVAVGDVFNCGRNALIVICGDGWVYLYYSPRSVRLSSNPLYSDTSIFDKEELMEQPGTRIKKSSTNANSGEPISLLNQKPNQSRFSETVGKMECVHVQRIPANTKVLLIADVDKDGSNEMVIGLTDRVVRSYRWSSNADLGTGKLVGLNKWECANQIGTVTLQDDSDGTPTLLVAQPGGTFMRIRCNAEDNRLDNDCFDTISEAAASCIDYQTLGISRMRNPNISTEILGNLRQKNTKLSVDHEERETAAHKSENEIGSSSNLRENVTTYGDVVDGNIIGGNIVIGESENRNDVQFHQSHENLSESNNSDHEQNSAKKRNSSIESSEFGMENLHKIQAATRPYALATLDGTIMLVKDEVILWAMQVDHQISALYPLDVTGDGADEIIVCTWDGQTYILDQQKNSVRFQFEEPVRAFCAGMYSVFPQSTSPCFVYNNFSNKILLYYDVRLPNMEVSEFDPDEFLDDEQRAKLNEILGECEGEERRARLNEILGDCDGEERRARLRQLTEYLLYGMGR
ncbi:hypothetical protein QAD02_014623 [Eretmocerus hayati]|uniref:Uncharacterized protein n=1 Tax=Eretmocerus hayati TaxID=131215 RepID=A0ACC2P7I6_9HYME|nr:hypothetical protein QAD02_014623 [Eretmocerus hayati]